MSAQKPSIRVEVVAGEVYVTGLPAGVTVEIVDRLRKREGGVAARVVRAPEDIDEIAHRGEDTAPVDPWRDAEVTPVAPAPIGGKAFWPRSREAAMEAFNMALLAANGEFVSEEEWSTLADELGIAFGFERSDGDLTAEDDLTDAERQRRARADLCETCKDIDHESCSLDSSCACCQTTMADQEYPTR